MPHRLPRPVCLMAALGLIAACAGGPRISTHASPGGNHALRDLRRAIDSMADDPAFANAHWGILIVDPEWGDTLYARNAGKLFMPASNMKLLTTSTALTQLGPDFRYATTVAAVRGPEDDRATVDELLVIGRGDPSVSDHMRTDAMIPLRDLADSIAARGIRHVRGGVRPWGNAFPGPVLGFGWSWDDFEDSYSAPTDELLFNEGFSVVHARGGAQPGDAVTAWTSPARTYPPLAVHATTAAPMPVSDSLRPRRSTLRIRKDTTTGVVVLEGEIAPGDSAGIEVTDRDPDAAYVAALREALMSRGITVDDSAVGVPADVALDTVATLQSPPLRDILPALLKPSQNQLAEMLFKTVALERTGVGRADSARAFEQRQLAEWGIPSPTEAVIRDGSGLSRYDYITPRTVIRILSAMRASPDFKVFYDALPIAGVDGTLERRMRGTPAEGNVHAKTGSVSQSRTLSGYVTTADGRLLEFSLLANNWTVGVRDVERVQDAICATLAALHLR